jgi:hypothetical protein
MATQWLRTCDTHAEAIAGNLQVLPDEFEAPRVGLEPTTNGLTVTPTPSDQSESVFFGAVLSRNFDLSCLCGVVLCGLVRLHIPARDARAICADMRRLLPDLSWW